MEEEVLETLDEQEQQEEEETQLSRRGLFVRGGLAAAGLTALGAPAAAFGAAQASRIKVAVVTHGDTGSFWSVFKKGVDQAAKDLRSRGVTVTQVYANNDVARQVSGINAAIAGGAHVIATSVPDASALKDPLRKASKKGIEIITVPNAKSDIPGTKAKVKAAVSADKKITGFLGLDPDVTIPCLSVLRKGMKAATFDVGGAIKEIRAGRMLFAIDQQQYLQGYLPVVFAMLWKTNLNTVGNGKPVLTGPGIINKSNAAKVAALAAKGTR